MKKLSLVLAVLALVSISLTACRAPEPQIVEKVVTQVVTREVPVVETQVVEKVVTREVEKIVEVAPEPYTTPHPILSDVRVRQAIAYCTDRDALIASVFPWLTAEQRAALRGDSFLPKGHWAYGGPYEAYEYDAAKGKALLEEAGWTAPMEGEVRYNASGDALAVKLMTTDTRFRQSWAAVMEQNLAECGIQLVRFHVPSAWWYGEATGLARRDFELGAFTWLGQPDPAGRTLYACDQIPLPGNGWTGQNAMGWCNETASEAIVAANSTLIRAERIAAYDVVQGEFAADMVSLPLFQHPEGEAWATAVTGIRLDPTEYGTASAAEWARSDDGDTIVIAFVQEPSSLFPLADRSHAAVQAGHLAKGVYFTRYGYDVQPVMQTELSTLESGLAVNETVEVGAGDVVYDVTGQAVPLVADVIVFDADGQAVRYDGATTLKMKQLSVTYRVKPFTWSDGVAGSQADLKLGAGIECDERTGIKPASYCRAVEAIEWGEGLAYTVTTVPGYQDPGYAVLPFGFYPAHQALADGRVLADVPPAEWQTLPEVAERPLSFGPFVLAEWQRGESLTFVANPQAEPQPKVQTIVIRIVASTEQALEQLLAGDLDYIEKGVLGVGLPAEAAAKAAAEGTIRADFIANPNWEHVDFNLYAK